MGLKQTAAVLLDGIGAGDPLRAGVAAWHRRAHRRASPALVSNYLGRETVRKLHIGASDKSLPGWLNTDIERHPGVAYLDCTRPFPFESDTFDYVYSEHFIEHLERDQGVACLREVLRCLKPGGVFRLATPDLDQYVGLFAPTLGAEQQRYLDQFRKLFGLEALTPCGLLNLAMHSWGHRFLYTRAELAEELRRAGFAHVDGAEVGESQHPALRGIEQHQKFCGDEMNRFETFVLEATK
jgi:predicted SAM-dependent methyltransferase